jgi:hypothetical protein
MDNIRPPILRSVQAPRALLLTAAGLGPNLLKGRNMDKVDERDPRVARDTAPEHQQRRLEPPGRATHRAAGRRATHL